MPDYTIDYLADRQEFVEELAQWLHDEWDGLYPGATLETRIAKVRNHLNRDSLPLAVVAFDESGPLGTASLIVSDMEHRPELTPWLASVLVTPKSRGRGIGSALIRRIIEECRGLGVGKAYLWTDKEERLYSKLGWNLDFREQYKDRQVSVMHYEL